MFTHIFAGIIIFLVFANLLDIPITKSFLITGAILGISTDILSFILKRKIIINKWSHTHRDNISHSIIVLPLIFFIFAILFKLKILYLIALVLASHPILDLCGIGWGVKIFYPIDERFYKLFWGGKIINIWTDKEQNEIAKKYGDDQWIRNTYFKVSFFGIIEYLTIICSILIIFCY